MLLKIKVKKPDDIIGLKEEIASRLEGIVEIIRIDVEERNDQNGKLQDHKEVPRRKL